MIVSSSLERWMKTSTDVLYDRIIAVFKRSPDRPVYLGQVANDIGWSLERTQEFLHTLVHNRIRPATTNEKLAIDAPGGEFASLYVLVR